MFHRRRRPPSDFAEEIESHLQLEADRLRAEGVPPAEAEAAARRAFGNVVAVRERFFEAGRWRWADHLALDLRYAARSLRRSPIFTSAAVISLALGIGANTAIFSFVNALLLRPYSFPDLDALVTVSETHPQAGGQAATRPADAGNPMTPGDFIDLRRQSRAFEGVAAFRSRDFTLLGSGDPERLAGRLVSPELFALLRARAARGRVLLPEEAQAGRDAVVVVSHGFWQRRLGAAPEAVGRTLVLNGRSQTVVGVMPPDFDYPPGGVEVWAPLVLGEREEAERMALSLAVVARLAPGVSLPQARADLAELAARAQRAFPRTNTGRTFVAARLREQQAGLTGPLRRAVPGRGAARAADRLRQRGRASCWRAASGAGARWRCGPPWGRAAGAWPASSWRRASCSPCWAAWSHSGWPGPACRSSATASRPTSPSGWPDGTQIRLDGRALGFALAIGAGHGARHRPEPGARRRPPGLDRVLRPVRAACCRAGGVGDRRSSSCRWRWRWSCSWEPR